MPNPTEAFGNAHFELYATGDSVLVHFGGSGSELEVCQKLGRHFLSAELDPKYHEMIVYRLKTGCIKEEYRLFVRQQGSAGEHQLALVEQEECLGLYTVPRF